MPHRKQGMIQQHTGAGKPHDPADFLPHLGLVAVHLTVGAKGLMLHKGTMLAAGPGIGRQLLTFLTHDPFPVTGMVFPAVEGYHFPHYLLFLLPLFVCLRTHCAASSGFAVFTLTKK